MSFVTQEEVWETMEPVIGGVFETFANGKPVTPSGSFPRIAYDEAMLKYGSDKPDLRNPLIITDVASHFTTSGFGLFEKIVAGGGTVRAIPAPGTADKSRKFFDDMNDWARSEGHAGLGYVTRKAGEFGGPIAKNHGDEGMQALYDAIGLGPRGECLGLQRAVGHARMTVQIGVGPGEGRSHRTIVGSRPFLACPCAQCGISRGRRPAPTRRSSAAAGGRCIRRRSAGTPASPARAAARRG